MKGSKRLKDPIYGYINIPNQYSKEIVDTSVFQRLRRIIQTSYSPLYASSIHNRFVHSLGVFHLGEIVANTITEQVQLKKWKIKRFNEIKETFLLACLLHDVGHAPFSHTGERFYLEDVPKGQYKRLHHTLTELIGSDEFLKDIPDSDIKSAAPHEVMSAIIGIKSFEKFFPTSFQKEFFARCITGYKYSNPTEQNSFLNCFISMLNSKVIDVDRLDYLIRDAFFTGFDTVSIDYERLLTSLTIVCYPADKEDEDDNAVKYEIAYQKNAISVIENVVYAHDAERKWIQNHPIVLYDIYIMQHVMGQLNQIVSRGDNKLFSLEALGEEGIDLSEDINISLFCDDDIIFLMKSKVKDSLSKEYFSRNSRRHPLWKSEAEYKAYFLQLFGEGKLLDDIEKALVETEKYIRKNSENWIINDKLVGKLEKEIRTLEGLDEKELPQIKKEMQLKKKKNISKVLKSLQKYADDNKEKCDFIILGASQFYSGFNRTDVSNINIVFNTTEGEKISKFGDIVSLLNSNEKWRDNFFYLYHKENSAQKNKENFFKNLISEFLN